MQVDTFNNHMSITDSNIYEYPILTPDDKLLTQDKIIVAYKDEDRFICVSARGNYRNS